MTGSKKKLPRVPESLLKRRRRYTYQLARNAVRAEISKKVAKEKRKVIMERAVNYALEYREMEKKVVDAKREAKKNNNYYVPAEPKLALVIRIRGINKVPPRVRKILQLFRLRQINNAVFMRLNKATLKMLRLVEHKVAWGYPNLKTVRELVYKRGHAKIKGNRIHISSNDIIEKHLGRFGIICMEDLIHELFTVGRYFKQCSRFLWPFKLAPPRRGFKDIKNHFVDGGDYGNREEKINRLVRRMN